MQSTNSEKCKIKINRTADGRFSYESNGKCSKDEIKAFMESYKDMEFDSESEDK